MSTHSLAFGRPHLATGTPAYIELPQFPTSRKILSTFNISTAGKYCMVVCRVSMTMMDLFEERSFFQRCWGGGGSSILIILFVYPPGPDPLIKPGIRQNENRHKIVRLKTNCSKNALHTPKTWPGERKDQRNEC
jgi:hypothetical protein